MSGTDDSKKRKMRDEKEDAKKKKTKKKKKKVKTDSSSRHSSACCVRVCIDCSYQKQDKISLSGSTSGHSGGADSSNLADSATMEDTACVLGLPKKDFARPPNVNQLDGVSSKQLAYALSCIDASVSASDVLECGGEHVPWLRVNGVCNCSRLNTQLEHVCLSYWSD